MQISQCEKKVTTIKIRVTTAMQSHLRPNLQPHQKTSNAKTPQVHGVLNVKGDIIMKQVFITKHVGCWRATCIQGSPRELNTIQVHLTNSIIQISLKHIAFYRLEMIIFHWEIQAS